MAGLSPIESLPNEILTHIFRLLRDHELEKTFGLTHVCSHWRAVIINDPVMWSTIYLDISSRFGRSRSSIWQKLSGATSLLSTALLRSENRPLVVRFVHVLPYRSNVPSEGESARDQFARALFALILDHSNRLATLALATNLLTTTGALIPRHSRRMFPRLRTLILNISAPPFNSLARQLILTETSFYYLTRIGRTSSLTHLYVKQFPDVLNLWMPSPEFAGFLKPPSDALSNLVHLVLHKCPKRAFLNLVRRASRSLIVCEIWAFEVDWCPPLKEDVCLPSLKMLTIPWGHDDIMEHLTARELTELVVVVESMFSSQRGNLSYMPQSVREDYLRSRFPTLSSIAVTALPSISGPWTYSSHRFI